MKFVILHSTRKNLFAISPPLNYWTIGPSRYRYIYTANVFSADFSKRDPIKLYCSFRDAASRSKNCEIVYSECLKHVKILWWVELEKTITKLAPDQCKFTDKEISKTLTVEVKQLIKELLHAVMGRLRGWTSWWSERKAIWLPWREEVMSNRQAQIHQLPLRLNRDPGSEWDKQSREEKHKGTKCSLGNWPRPSGDCDVL